MRLEISGAIQAARFDHSTTLQHTRRAARHRPTEITLAGLNRLGRGPVEVMERVSGLHHKGVRIRLASDETSRDIDDQFVPALLTALSSLERQETARRTSKAIQIGRARGSSAGRPLVMTPERRAIAARMLLQGKRGRQILQVIRGLGGPSISQSAYYLWQRAWLAGGADGTRR